MIFFYIVPITLSKVSLPLLQPKGVGRDLCLLQLAMGAGAMWTYGCDRAPQVCLEQVQGRSRNPRVTLHVQPPAPAPASLLVLGLLVPPGQPNPPEHQAQQFEPQHCPWPQQSSGLTNISTTDSMAMSTLPTYSPC